MSHGKILEAERTEVVIERPGHVLVAGFLGSPPMNVIGGYFQERGGFAFFRHEKANFQIPVERLPESVRLGDANYYHLGVRPEDLRLSTAINPFYQGVVTGLEHRGFDHVVTLAGAGPEIKVLARGAAPGWGERAAVETGPGKLFLFDRRGVLISAGLGG
jgi:multiple sugar transport system ATP-binding protein